MNEMGCEQLEGIGAELVLGLLPGHQRAEALGHLTACDRCREHVRQLTSVSEGVLELVPGIEPPVGCESRVMERLALAGPRSPRYRWRKALVAAAAAAALAGFGAGGWALGTAGNPGAARVEGPTAGQGVITVATQELTAPDKRHVGQIYVHGGDSPWVYMTVDAEGTNGMVTCQLQRTNGSYSTVGSFELANGYGSWGGPTGINPGDLAGARLLDDQSRTVATARLNESR